MMAVVGGGGGGCYLRWQNQFGRESAFSTISAELPDGLDIRDQNEEIRAWLLSAQMLWLSRQLRDKFSGSHGKHLCVTRSK